MIKQFYILKNRTLVNKKIIIYTFSEVQIMEIIKQEKMKTDV